jgi:hypothetical protein
MKNKKAAFMGLGFELVALMTLAILAAPWISEKTGFKDQNITVVLIFVGFSIWSIQLTLLVRKKG